MGIPNIPSQEHTDEFREQAVRRVKSGQPVGAVARELGLAEQTLDGWINASESGHPHDPGAERVMAGKRASLPAGLVWWVQPGTLGTLLALMAAALLLGMLLAPEVTKRLVPGAEGVGMNTALCLVLLGLALRAGDERSHPAWRVALRAAVAGMALVVLAQLLLGGYPGDGLWRLLLNTLPDPGAWQGRMSPPAAVVLFLYAAAFLMHQRLGRRAPTLIFIALGLGFLVALAQLTGYLARVVLFDSERAEVGHMNLPVAIMLLLAGLAGWRQARRLPETRRWRQQSPAQDMLVHAVGILAIALVVGGVTSAGFMLRGENELALLAIVLVALVGGAALYPPIVPVLERIRRSEAHLRATLRQRDLLLRHAGQGIYGIDAQGRLIFVNPAAEALLGHGAAELIGRDMHRLIHHTRRDGETYPAGGCPIQATLRDGRNRQVGDEVFWRVDGTSMDVEYTVAALQEEGRIVGAVVLFSDVSERRRAEADLARWRRIFEHAEWGIFIGSADGQRYELMNPAFARMHGYNVREMSGMPIAEVFAPECRADLAENIRLTHERGHHVWESWHLRRDGSRFPVQLDVTAVKDEAGRVLYRVVNVQDISLQKAREEHLRHSEAKLRLMLEHLPVGVWLLNAYGRIVYGNPAARAIWGGVPYVSRGQFHIFEGWWAEGGRKLEPEEWGGLRALDRGETCLGEVIDIQSFDGRRKTILHSALPLPGADGRREGAIVINQDITEARRAELALREREASLAQAQALAHLGSWRLDVVANALEWSEETYRIFGLAPGSPLTYESFLSQVHPDDLESVDRAWRAAVHGEPYDIKHRILVNGLVRWVRERAELEFGQDGSLVRGVGTTQDITELKQQEEDLLRSRQMLRELAAHHERIREEERARIAREIHDELGQYLTALRMDTALLRIRFGKDNPALDQQVTAMTRNIDTTIGAVRDIAAALRPGALDMGLVSAAEWLLGGFEERTGILCNLEAQREDLGLDDQRATAAFRILQECLTNIARHAEASQVDVYIGRMSDALRMRIDDNGRGFDPAVVRQRKTFGLMGMRERALMFGGELHIDSTMGEGTIVNVSIPLREP